MDDPLLTPSVRDKCDAIGFALVIVFFLPEIELRKTNRKPTVEAGVELDAELGQSDSAHEPEV